MAKAHGGLRLVMVSLLALPTGCGGAERGPAHNTNVAQTQDRGMRNRALGHESSEPLFWNSPKMTALKQQWDRLEPPEQRWNLLQPREAMREGPHARDAYERSAEMKYELLETCLSKWDLRELLASCGTLPVDPTKRDNFTESVLERIVRVFVDSGDRDSLVTMLSTRFPRRWYYTEDFLARGERLKDPILILGEAYSKCRIAEVRTQIANAVRRGFTDLGVRGKDDDEFVTNAMEWYKLHKDQVEVNSSYGSDTGGMTAHENPRIMTGGPLFLLRPAGKRE